MMNNPLYLVIGTGQVGSQKPGPDPDPAKNPYPDSRVRVTRLGRVRVNPAIRVQVTVRSDIIQALSSIE